MTPADVNAYYNSPNNYIGVYMLSLNPLDLTLIPRFEVVLYATTDTKEMQRKCSPWQVFAKFFEVKVFWHMLSKMRGVNHYLTNRTLSRLLIFLP